MAAPSSQESDISYATAVTEESDSDDEFLDVPEDGEWRENADQMQFNEFDESQSGPQHNLDGNASVFDYFSLFWGFQLLNLIANETNRYIYLSISHVQFN